IIDSKLKVLGTNRDGSPRYPAKGESRITLKNLEHYGHGLICLAGGVNSPLSRILARGGDPRDRADHLRSIFGADNLFFALPRHFDAESQRLKHKLFALPPGMWLPP